VIVLEFHVNYGQMGKWRERGQQAKDMGKHKVNRILEVSQYFVFWNQNKLFCLLEGWIRYKTVSKCKQMYFIPQMVKLIFVRLNINNNSVLPLLLCTLGKHRVRKTNHINYNYQLWLLLSKFDKERKLFFKSCC
jgi:hypothetical protein